MKHMKRSHEEAVLPKRGRPRKYPNVEAVHDEDEDLSLDSSNASSQTSSNASPYGTESLFELFHIEYTEQVGQQPNPMILNLSCEDDLFEVVLDNSAVSPILEQAISPDHFLNFKTMNNLENPPSQQPDKRQEYGLTPLMTATLENKALEVHRLIKGGANLNEVNKLNATALHIAAVNGYSGLVLMLLEAGIDSTIKNVNDATAQDLAQREYTKYMEQGASQKAKAFECVLKVFAKAQREKQVNKTWLPSRSSPVQTPAQTTAVTVNARNNNSI